MINLRFIGSNHMMEQNQVSDKQMDNAAGERLVNESSHGHKGSCCNGGSSHYHHCRCCMIVKVIVGILVVGFVICLIAGAFVHHRKDYYGERGARYHQINGCDRFDKQRIGGKNWSNGGLPVLQGYVTEGSAVMRGAAISGQCDCQTMNQEQNAKGGCAQSGGNSTPAATPKK
jgi:hypothetical protein